jgi:DNA-binding transcriptional ArsR family regulator
MVNLSDSLTQTFFVLADPTRRALIERLHRDSSLSVSELAEPFEISLPAVMKHLDVLADASMVTRTKEGRVVRYSLTPSPLDAARDWIDRHRSFWNESLDRLEARVQARASGRAPNRRRAR